MGHKQQQQLLHHTRSPPLHWVILITHSLNHSNQQQQQHSPLTRDEGRAPQRCWGSKGLRRALRGGYRCSQGVVTPRDSVRFAETPCCAASTTSGGCPESATRCGSLGLPSWSEARGGRPATSRQDRASRAANLRGATALPTDRDAGTKRVEPSRAAPGQANALWQCALQGAVHKARGCAGTRGYLRVPAGHSVTTKVLQLYLK